ncbi:MAG: 4Fe-4S binding protein [Clostridia bacterium]|nr:4Fe-4S binding protein [Clostridia bacterium]
MLVEEMHSAAVATIGGDGKPHIRIIDMMLYDDGGVYFLTAKGKEFYTQLMAQKFIALSAVSGKKSLSLRGYVKNIGNSRLEEIFEKNSYMKGIYPEGTRQALQVFCLYSATGEYFDISEPSNVRRDSFFIGEAGAQSVGYFVSGLCTGCKKCLAVCPQKCINVTSVPAVIDGGRCLNCGNCAAACPVNAIKMQV